MPDGTLQMVNKQLEYVCESGEGLQFNLGYTFHTLREFFYDDKIKIHCEIINPSAFLIFPESFTARTRLGTEIINCLWEIRSFLSFPTFSSPFPVTHDSSHKLEIKGMSWEHNSLVSLPSVDEHLNIIISTVDENIEYSTHVEGKISLLNAEKGIALSIDSKHIFLSGGGKKNWNFVIPFSRKKIVETCNLHRTNEKLSLLCKFTFYISVNGSLEYTILPRLCQDMRKEVLRCGFESWYSAFPGPQSILCARSPVFKDMFDADLRKRKPEEVTIGLDADITNQFLLFLYSENLENLQWESAKRLLHAAYKFQVKSLKMECCSFLKSKFCLSNVCEALKIAYMYQDYELRRECEKFIFPNASEVFSSENGRYWFYRIHFFLRIQLKDISI
ncbi:unnamed protein product [Larinioides sclopetarius]|uniref:BTB domain-containing protein n=1 Tax=Larinioides sclopetarius TaxID=280406 RepID=A0AAV2B497_9ARAC